MADPKPLVAVDPGIRGCGVAVFDADGILARADYVKNAELGGNGPMSRFFMVQEIRAYVERVSLTDVGEFDVAFEFMRAYAAGQQKGDQNDLLVLCAVVDRLAGVMGVMGHGYYPSEWKGNISKEQSKARVMDRLTPTERERVGKPGPKLDTWDAIGIGLHHLGRFKPRKVYPR